MPGPHPGLTPDSTDRNGAAAAANALGCADCPVRDSAVCAVLSAEERLALSGIGRTVSLQSGQTLFDAGEDALACATLIEGSLKLSRLDEDGTERLFAIVHPSGFLGRLFSAETDVTATALTPARLCVFPRAAFEQVLADRPHLMRQILSRTMQALEESRALVELIGRRSVKDRLCGFIALSLHGQCAAPADEEPVLDLPLDRRDLAALLGTTIETLSRQFGALEDEGTIRREGNRRIRITDPAMLGL
ncbi:Crp/Fnr family transcriptional regulator [Novosphingopyxis baekryungensis]|uniref:Crp/Fnr family transcriptional regulator n=1 Tax=Novosphingopyxis baekryungensis TaxID=279369 RepID=UPI000A027AD1|nr:Crp/Fnr family transcriptional regulator [Novosphingopyxis baekryungensis]